MSKIEEFCCGKCLYYNGDMRDKKAFCDEREDYVSRNYYCYRYEENDEPEGAEKMSEYLDYMPDVQDVQSAVNDLALKMYQQGRADAFGELVAKYKEFQNAPCDVTCDVICDAPSCDGECIKCFEIWYKGQKNETTQS